MKTENKKVQEALWQECRRIIKSKYEPICFTCDKPISGSNCQLGHFIPRSVGGVLLRYNLDNLRLQCYYCNINLGGNGSEFYPRLVKEKGKKFVNNLFKLKGKKIRKPLEYYNLLLIKYKLIKL